MAIMFEYKAYAVAFSALIGIVWVAVLPFAILSFVKARLRKDAARTFVAWLRASMVLFVVASSLFFAQSVILVNSYFASFVDWRVARASIHLGHLVQLFKTLSGAAVMVMLVVLSPDLRYAMAGAGTKSGKMLRVAAMGLAFVVAVPALAAYGLGVDYEEKYSAIWNAASLSNAVNRARVTNQLLAATDIMLWIAALFIAGLSIFTIVHRRDSPLVTACFLYILASLLNLTGATWNFAYAVGWKLTPPRRSMNPEEPQYLMILLFITEGGNGRTHDTPALLRGLVVSALEAYNTTKQAYDIIDAADRSEEATRFWTELRNYDGIVAIDDAFAEQLKLPPSVPHPDNPNTNIYQVNVFHSLHCLYRIRNRLISKVPLDKWPRDDIHTMHCLDHIRNDLMCNVDLSLSGSSEYISFNHGHQGKKCRDLGAVQDWSRRNAWTGYRKYLVDVIGFDLMEAERANLAAAGGGHWNKANSTFDKETGKITFWFEEE
ncbi:Phenylalanine aminomutase [Colletotrichum trifolii]|uniref:Phenylalanine aminomutase n=1 Tax=Colletotrichum trifolii TaxID=5466 RepID=A0A4R8QCB0_COLTR|nr:Phenylalanine aminomutase [Colletotrichum trifolii]